MACLWLGWARPLIEYYLSLFLRAVEFLKGCLWIGRFTFPLLLRINKDTSLCCVCLKDGVMIKITMGSFLCLLFYFHLRDSFEIFFLIDHIVFSALMSLHIIFILSTWNTTCDHSSSSPSSLTFFPIFFPFLNCHVLWIQSYTIETDVIFI